MTLNLECGLIKSLQCEIVKVEWNRHRLQKEKEQIDAGRALLDGSDDTQHVEMLNNIMDVRKAKIKEKIISTAYVAEVEKAQSPSPIYQFFVSEDKSAFMDKSSSADKLATSLHKHCPNSMKYVSKTCASPT